MYDVKTFQQFHSHKFKQTILFSDEEEDVTLKEKLLYQVIF